MANIVFEVFPRPSYTEFKGGVAIMEITADAASFLLQLMERQNKGAIRIGYNENSM
ncbi:hypothetical protein J2S74_003065 [Evansella vedderi]|uniref:Uncharacterized protein n=1 Tax=Evansella vedderi TaxID=38282 RepID=A0ABT9ZZ14_9BACI|nr:hypothetical protein [Evansella vedderi]MDQ0255683.1 hypothetical protein [Evansella vedderi]